MRIQDEIDALRGRFVRCWRSVDELHRKTLTINRNTLTRFLRGDSVTQDTMQAIDAWCERREVPHGDRLSD